MTAPSRFRQIIDAMPNDDGTRIDGRVVEAQPAAPPVSQPEPIRPIEYLLLRNRSLDRLIQQQFDRDLLKTEGVKSAYNTNQWEQFDDCRELIYEIFDLPVILYWEYADAYSERFAPPKPFKWQSPCIILVIVTQGLPFSTEAEMLQYVAAIPKPRPWHEGGGYHWSATRITKDRLPSASADNPQSEMDEHPQITRRDQIQHLITYWFDPRDGANNWPEDDDPVVQLRAFEEWIQSRQPPDLADRIQRWLAAGRNVEIYNRLGRRRDRAAGAEQVEMLVDGLVPARIVTLLVGERESGKSTIATELAVAIATGRDHWLGRKINGERAKGVAILLTGEDSDAVVNGRLTYLDPDDKALRLVVYALDSRPLSDLLAEIRDNMPDVSLIVVDPARRPAGR